MTKKPGKLSGSKSARTRERILDAAAHVLSRKGFAGTRLTDVADQAELQAPAIYYYFPSREDMIEEVMWTGITRIHDHIRDTLAALPEDTEPIEKVDVAVAAHLRYALEISDYTTASIRNASQLPDEIRARYSVGVASYGDVWRTLFQEAANAGMLRQELEPRAARMLAIGALNWATEWWNSERGTLDEVVRTAQSLLRNGLWTQEALAGERPKPRKAHPKR